MLPTFQILGNEVDSDIRLPYIQHFVPAFNDLKQAVNQNAIFNIYVKWLFNPLLPDGPAGQAAGGPRR